MFPYYSLVPFLFSLNKTFKNFLQGQFSGDELLYLLLVCRFFISLSILVIPLLSRVFRVGCSFFSALCRYHTTPFWPAEFLLKNQLIVLWGFPCTSNCFSPAAFMILYLTLDILIIMCLGVDLFEFFLFGTLWAS